MLIGTAEVIYDNSAQTFLPAIVDNEHLERANGRMFSAELVANQFAGPPLASLLLAVGFVLPVLFDARVVRPVGRTGLRHRGDEAGPGPGAVTVERQSFKAELTEGFRWLWHHDLIRAFAIALGALNLLGTMATAVFVLWGQEVLGTSALEFGLLVDGRCRRRRRRGLDGVVDHHTHRLRGVGRPHPLGRCTGIDRHRARRQPRRRRRAAGRDHVHRRSSGTSSRSASARPSSRTACSDG